MCLRVVAGLVFRRLSHIHDPVAEYSSKYLGFALWRKEFDNFRGQSVITYFCVDKLSESQISLLDELSLAITSIFDELCGEFTFSWILWNWFRSWKCDSGIRLSSTKLFSKGDSIQHTCNVYIWFIYLLFSEKKNSKLRIFCSYYTNYELPWPALVSDQ